MFAIYSKKQHNNTGYNLFNKLFERIQVIIGESSEGGFEPISNAFWR
jgi:hypothetical protein